MTDAKPVADLRREAHIRRWYNFKYLPMSGNCNGSGPCSVCDLADLAEALQKEAFGEHTLAQEWQGRAEAAEQHVKILREARDEALTRIANEVAARQRAQEHGIVDRARIEELERERDALQVALNNVSGALVDSGVPVPIEVRYGEAVRGIVRERDGLRGLKRSVDEALNSGDGVYRP